MKNCVGIIIVSHNSYWPALITGAGLQKALNETSFKVILIDNASAIHELSLLSDVLSGYKIYIIYNGTSYSLLKIKELRVGMMLVFSIFLRI